jgi:alkaline phosphatase D
MKCKLTVFILFVGIVLLTTIVASGQTVDVTIPDTSGKSGESIMIPVRVSDLSGLFVFSYSLTLTYDPGVLDATGVTVTNTLTESWGMPIISDQSGQFLIAAAGSTVPSGAGILVFINFDVVGNPCNSTSLDLSGVLFNEGVPAANTQNGGFFIPPDFKITHGPVAGAVTSNSARFAVRTDTVANIKVIISEDSTSWSNPIYTNEVTTEAGKDYFCLVDATGLTPNTTYYYSVVSWGVEKDDFVGMFKTFPQEGEAAAFSFLFGSGQQAMYDDPNSGIGNIFPGMAKEGALFFLHQGDWGYPDTTDSEQGDSLNYFATHFDLIYQSYKSRYDPTFPMAEMLKVMPVDYVYDDHDWVNDNCDATYMAQGGANTIQVYQEAFPHYPLASTSNGIWHKFNCGNADFFMVDNRAQRDPNLNALFWHPTLNRYVFTAHYLDNHTILGEEQMNWLIDQLKASTATWKFISSGTPFNPAWRGLIELALLLQGSAYDPIIDPATGAYCTMAFLAEEFSDKWNGFPSDIYKLLSTIIENNIENVLFLSGDTHTSAIDDGTNSLIPELMGGGLDRTNSQFVAVSKELFKIDVWNKGGHTYDNAVPPDLGNAYGKVSVFGPDSARLEVVSETGNILAKHSVRPGYVPRRVAGIVVPGAMDFGSIMADTQGVSAAIAVCTSIDNFEISNISVTNLKGSSQIVPLETTASLASGQSKVFPFALIPTQGSKFDTTLAMIVFHTNDPAGNYTIYAQGVGWPVGVESREKISLPSTHELDQNYPNPFNPKTTIKFSLPEPGYVEMYIVNVLGQRVRTLINTDMKAGYHKIAWDGINDKGLEVRSGIYFIVMKSGDVTKLRKIMLVK